MTHSIEFALVPIDRLQSHEEIDEKKVGELLEEFGRRGRFVEPIWVARESYVILNGHHRVEALRRLGADRVPAWLVDYHSPDVKLDRWAPGPPIAKDEVVRRAQGRELFPPKTTRHKIEVDLPPCDVPLEELLPSSFPEPTHSRASGRSRRPRAARSRSR
jgi:L-serine kinase (ADP)